MISGLTCINYSDLCFYMIPGTDQLIEMNIPKERSQALREWMTRIKPNDLPLDEVQTEFDRWYEERTQLIKDIKSTLGPLIK